MTDDKKLTKGGSYGFLFCVGKEIYRVDFPTPGFNGFTPLRWEEEFCEGGMGNGR